MDFNHTQQQSSDEQSRAQALSLKPSRPPTQVPGYEPRRFLGAGAYGEVWVAVDRNTGRAEERHGRAVDLLDRLEAAQELVPDRVEVLLLDAQWGTWVAAIPSTSAAASPR